MRRLVRRGWLANLMITGAAVAQTGCSLAFVDAPPAAAPSLPYFDCTSSRLAPNTDAALAALFALTAIGAASDSQTSADTTGEVTATALAAGMLISAIHGWRVTADCREAKGALAARLQLGAGWNNRPPPTDPWWGSGADLLPPASLTSPRPPQPPIPQPPATTPPAAAPPAAAPPPPAVPRPSPSRDGAVAPGGP